MSQFQPGHSGNPAGRPRGSVNRQLKMLREAAERVLPLVLERALAGDADAQKLIIERGMPRMKSVAPEESFYLPAGGLAEQMQALLQQVANGELSVTAATQTMAVVEATAKAREEEARQAAVSAARQAAAQAPMASSCSTYLSVLRSRQA